MPYVQEPDGFYMIEQEHPNGQWSVRLANTPINLSFHATKTDAKAAVKQYQRQDWHPVDVQP